MCGRRYNVHSVVGFCIIWCYEVCDISLLHLSIIVAIDVYNSTVLEELL